MKRLNIKTAVLFLITSIITSSGLISCDEPVSDGNMTAREALEFTSSSAAATHQIVSLAQNVLDLTTGMLAAEGISIEATNASTTECAPTLLRQYVLDDTHYDTLIYGGTITMDYGNGLSCNPAEKIQQGKMKTRFTYIINFQNSELTGASSSSSQQVTFENFKLDDAGVEGILTVMSRTGSVTTLQTNSSTITFENNKAIQWHGTLASSTTHSDRVNGHTSALTGTLQGSTPDRKYFSVEIVKAIQYSYDCENSLIPVSGNVKMKVAGIDATMDYGQGSCDRNYSVTIGDRSQNYSF